MPDPLHARVTALEVAFKALAQLLHEHRIVRLDTLADALESRAGVLALAGAPELAGVRAVLSELAADLRETTAELPRDDA